MITIPPIRVYLYAVKKAWEPVLWHTLYLWVCAIALCYFFCHILLWQQWGRWFPLSVIASYVVYLDVKVAIMILRHEEKKKWRHHRIRKETI